MLNDDQGGHMAKLTDSLWWFEPAGVFRAGLTPSHPHETLSVAKQSNHPHLSLLLCQIIHSIQAQECQLEFTYSYKSPCPSTAFFTPVFFPNLSTT